MTDPLVALVDKATSEYLVQTDWPSILQICDALNRENNPLGCRDVLRQAAKRMKEKKTRVALYALEIIETLVKNCECIHSYVGGKEFQAELIKLVQNKKTKEQVRDRALELIQYWADSFQTRRDLPLFNQTHLLLRRAGITFPPRRIDEPPLVFKTAPHPVHHEQRQSPTHPPRQDSASTGLKDFSALQENVNLVMEMLAYTNPEEEDPSTNEILRDLINTCKESAPSVREAIENGNFSSTLLALNDELVKIQEMFDDLVARRQLFLTHGPQPKPAPTSPARNDILDLADAFGPISLNPPQQPQHHHGYSATTTPAPSNPLGDLDFLSTGPIQPVQAQVPIVNPVSSYSSFPAPPQQQPYITTVHQPTYNPQAQVQSTYNPQAQVQSTYNPQAQVQPTYPTKAPVPATQNSYVNPFLDTPAKQGGGSAAGGGDFDEFDLLASSRHPAPAPVPLATPLQPTPAKPQTQSLYFPPTTAPTTTTAPPLVPLVPGPATGSLYNPGSRTSTTSPINPLYPAPPATNPTYFPPTGSGMGMGGAPYMSTYPTGQPMQPLQPMQPMQPLQPTYSTTTSYPAYNPLQAGGYRPQ